MGRPLSYTSLSLWHETADDDWRPRPALAGDEQVDVAVVGAGLTGLWTAYYLLREDPTLRVSVLEAETAGFGASGRNGGWCSALFPASLDTLAALPGSSRSAALEQHQAMRATVDEVLAVAAEEGIDARAHKGGTVAVARSVSQWRRARQEVAAARGWGRGEDDLRLLDAAQARERLGATGSSAAPSPRTAPRSTPRGWCAGWPARWSGAAGGSTSRPGCARSRWAGPSPTTAPSGPTSWCAPPRATPAPWRPCGATWCPSTPWSSPPSRWPTPSGRRSGCGTARRSPTTAT